MADYDIELEILVPDDFIIIDEIPEIVDLTSLGSEQNNRFESEVVRLTNIERTHHGLSPLIRNENLDRSAWAHTFDMSQNRFISHTGSNGSNLADRVVPAGYHNWRTIGENVAMGYLTPKTVVQGWMDSLGHRKNILNREFQEIGVAYIEGKVLTSQGGSFRGGYWTQNFGTRSTLNQLAETIREGIQTLVRPQDDDLDITIYE